MSSLDAVAGGLQPAEDGSGLQPIRRQAAIAAVLIAMMLVVLDAAMANVALPSIARSLQVTPARSVLVVSCYQLALVMALLPCAALGESWGYRRVFVVGVTVFTAASMASALSPSMPWLIISRFIQGLGGAGVMALGMALIRLVVSSSRLRAAIGWNALVVALSSAAGPAIGSLILSFADWSWLFALNVPIGLLVLFAARALPDHIGTGRRVDFLSVALSAGSLAALFMAADRLVTETRLAATMFVISAMGLALLAKQEIPKRVPLVPFDLLSIPTIRMSAIASMCCFAGQTAAMISLPLYLHYRFGLGTLTTGFYLTAWPLAVAVGAPIAARLAKHMSTACLCATGATLLASGLLAASLLPLALGPLLLVPFIMLCGFGFGLFNVPNNHAMYLSAPIERSGAAGGMQGTARLLGQTAGAVTMTLLFTVSSVEGAPPIGLEIGSALTFLAGLVSLLRTEPSPQIAR